MELRSPAAAEPFTTKDGSTIRELHRTAAQTLAEASLAAGQSTRRHFHARTEEIDVVLEGRGEMEVAGERAQIGPGDAVLVPPRALARAAGARADALPLRLRAAVRRRRHFFS